MPSELIVYQNQIKPTDCKEAIMREKIGNNEGRKMNSEYEQ